MTTYTISETTHVNAYREGFEYNTNSLAKAKRYASRSQFFLGTVLKIEEDGILVAYKQGGKWHDLVPESHDDYASIAEAFWLEGFDYFGNPIRF